MIIETKGNKIVGIRNEEVQANTKLYKVVFQPTEKDDIKTIELNTLTASRMEAGEAQQKDYYYMEITHIPTGKIVFTYTDGKVWEYTEEFEMMISEKEEVQEMEQIIITNTNYIEVNFEKVQPMDEHIVNDIELCMINNSRIAGQIGEINQSIAKKVKAGKFDEHKAIKAYYNRVNAYLETYNTKIYDNYFYNKNMVSVHDRFIIAYNIYFANMERIEALSKLWSRGELSNYFREYKKQLPQEIKKDIVALKTELCFELDRLNKDGKVSDDLVNEYIFPKDIVNY